MEKENFVTPRQTPRNARNTAKRADNSSKPCCSNSPIVINLDMCEDDLRKEVAKKQEIINEQTQLIEKLQNDLKSKVSQSIYIETSTKISDQAKRVHNNDISLMDNEISSVRRSLHITKNDLASEQATRKRRDKEIERLAKIIEEKDDIITTLRDNILRAERKADAFNQREATSQIELDTQRIATKAVQANLDRCQKDLELERTKNEKLAKENDALREKIDELKKELREVERRLEMQLCETTPRIVELTSPEKRLYCDGSPCAEHSLIQHTSTTHVLADVHQKIGALSVTNTYQIKEIEQLQSSLTTLQREMEEKADECETAKGELAALRQKMIQFEGNADAANEILLAENDKVKAQKAELRVELMRKKQECQTLTEKIKQLESAQKVVENLQKEKDRESDTSKQLTDAVVAAERKAAELEKTISELREENEKLDEELKRERAEMEMRLEKNEKTIADLKKGVQLLDEDVELLQKQKERAEAARKRADDECTRLKNLLHEHEEAADRTRANEAEIADLKAERDRLKMKVRYLNEELNETHTDYKADLAQMAKQISEKRKQDYGVDAHTLSELNAEKNRLETEVKTATRQVEQLTKEIEALNKQMEDGRAREKVVEEENAKLRQGLSDALQKIEGYKEEAETAKELCSTMSETVAKGEEKNERLEVEISDLEEVIREKERLVSYLQSQTNAKQMPKVSRKSTLLRQPSNTSTSDGSIIETSEILELESKKAELYSKLEKKKNELTARRVEQLAPPKPARAPLSPIVNRNIGMMRHNIPHRWKATIGFGIRQMKCATCFEGVSRVRYAMQCLECNVVVHRKCAARVENTCGLPDQCAKIYLDSHHHIPPTQNGWVRLYKDDQPQKGWHSAWARLDGSRFLLFDNDGLAENTSRAFFSVDLSEAPWSVSAASDAPHAERKGANYIHLRFPECNLYMLLPSDQARVRWAEALHSVRGARLEATRRPSTTIANSTLILALDAPSNLSMNATFVLDDWLLIGAQEGLFVTSLSNPRVPFSLSGISSVYALEGAWDIGMMFAISGNHRSLAQLSFCQLKADLCNRQPIVRPTVMSSYQNLHLVRYTKVGSDRCLMVCTASDIHVLRFRDKSETFAPLHVLPTTEPAVCLLPTKTGFFFGSDSYYSVTLDDAKPSVRCMASSSASDCPIDILPIGENELLLAYQNCGRFVTLDGSPSRKERVEWDQMPLEFCYTAPYLYVLSYYGMEILQVCEYTGPSSSAFHSEREYMKTTGAHILSRRVNGDVHIALASDSRTELHSFNAAQKRTLKRKGSAGILDKRSKVNSSVSLVH